MVSEFSSIGKIMKTYLTYSELFGNIASKEEIKRDIRSINLNEALSIISQFLLLSDKAKSNIKNNLSPFIKDKEFIESLEPFDVSNLMYAMKWFIAYGKDTPTFNFKNTYTPTFNVLMTILKITDYMVEHIDEFEKEMGTSRDVEDTVLQGFLFSRDTDISRSLLRQHIMFEEIARNKNLFEPKEFIDIHKIFERKYGYTIAEYVSTVFSLNYYTLPIDVPKETLKENDRVIDAQLFFKDCGIKEKAIKVYEDLCIEPNTLKEWAKDTLLNPYDLEPFLVNPIFKIGTKGILSSPPNMNAIIFDGLFFKIKNCLGKDSKKFFDFFGRLFEQYISDILKAAVKEAKINGYKFIDEFIFDTNGNKKSSDAYIRLGGSLLIVECKSGRIRKEAKTEANHEIVEKAFEKFVIEPIEQANRAYLSIIDKDPEKFDKIKKVFILSVGYNSFPKLPKYHEKIKGKAWQKTLSNRVKYIDYMGLDDIEIIAYIIENLDSSVFQYIHAKSINSEYIPHSNYFYDKFGKIKRINTHNKKIIEIVQQIKNTMKFNAVPEKL